MRHITLHQPLFTFPLHSPFLSFSYSVTLIQLPFSPSLYFLFSFSSFLSHSLAQYLSYNARSLSFSIFLVHFLSLIQLSLPLSIHFLCSLSLLLCLPLTQQLSYDSFVFLKFVLFLTQYLNFVNIKLPFSLSLYFFC